jgi:hypothetical protein
MMKNTPVIGRSVQFTENGETSAAVITRVQVVNLTVFPDRCDPLVRVSVYIEGSDIAKRSGRSWNFLPDENA